jgi:uncharacterized protein YdhG (YjbR/CyaY superfamily)
MKSEASTVDEYLAELPDERRAAIEAVRDVILERLPDLSAVYADDDARDHFEEAYRATGKRFDMGKSCVRFRRLDDLPLDVIGDAIEAVPVSRFIETYERGRSAARSRTKAR